jgi:peptide-methionine (S)-S-oxide reductase
MVSFTKLAKSLSLIGVVAVFACVLAFVASATSGTSATGAAGRSAARAAKAPIPSPGIDEPLASKSGSETMVVAGGCFWGVQAVFESVRGVMSATSGYAGGSRQSADYETVSTGRTGHAESVRVVFDPARVSYGQLLKIFFSVAHDPTQLNQQGPDVGTQYRSAIFYADAMQQKIAKAYIEQLDGAKVFHGKIVTEVTPLTKFYDAEAYHQNYFFNHPLQPYIVFNDKPKVEALKQQFPDLFIEHR